MVPLPRAHPNPKGQKLLVLLKIIENRISWNLSLPLRSRYVVLLSPHPSLLSLSLVSIRNQAPVHFYVLQCIFSLRNHLVVCYFLKFLLGFFALDAINRRKGKKPIYPSFCSYVFHIRFGFLPCMIQVFGKAFKVQDTMIETKKKKKRKVFISEDDVPLILQR